MKDIQKPEMISVLYVDDEKELLTLGKRFLEQKHDLEVDTSIGVTGAMEKLKSTSYDVIVSDYQMPGPDGIELLKEVRSQFGDNPFILFSGKGREEVMIQAINNGVDFYLQKSTDIVSQYNELHHMIHRAVDQRREKEELQKSITRLHHAEAVAGFGHWTFHPGTRTLTVSPGARAIYGIEDLTLTIPEVQQITLPEFRQFLNNSMKNLIEEQKSFNIEFKIKRRSDGKIIDIHLIAEYDPLEKQVFGTIQDITRKNEGNFQFQKTINDLHAAGEMRSSSGNDHISNTDTLTTQRPQRPGRADLPEHPTDTSSEGIVYQVIMDPDGNRHFQYVNPAVQSIHGVSAAEVLKDPSLLYRQIFEEDIPALIEKEKQALKNKTPFTAEARIHSPDGQVRWILLRSVPREMPGGSIVWDGFEFDITEQKKTEEALKESNELFTQLMRHSPIYIYIKTVTPDESRVLYASENFQEMIGIPGSEMKGKTMKELFPAEFAAKITADDWAVVTHGKVLKLHENMNGRYYITIKFPIFQQKRILLAGYTLDITDLKQTQDALHEANHKLRLLTGLTRHDIFNQIQVIQGFQELIAETSDLTEVHEFVSRARKSCDQIIVITGFTREYEEFGTAFSGWQRIFSIIESAKGEVNLDEIVIENRIPEDLEVYADPIIRKVFTSLLENAIRHGEKVRLIRFFCYEKEHDLIITCEDDGAGIPDRDKRRIFSHGYGKNTGMGLFLSGEILSITGLTIQECGEYGKGARFEILIPKEKFRRMGR